MNHVVKMYLVSIIVFLASCASTGGNPQSQDNLAMESPMTDKVTLVVTSEPNMAQQEAMREYVQRVMPLLLNLGGVVVKRSMLTEAYLGDKRFTYLLVMDFPSKKALKEMFASDAYQSLIPNRNKGFNNIDILLADDLK